MNKLIKELAEHTSHQSPDGYPVTIPYSKDFVKKFAHLLIERVLQEVRDECQYEYDWKLADSVTKRVKDTFGIEE